LPPAAGPGKNATRSRTEKTTDEKGNRVTEQLSCEKFVSNQRFCTLRNVVSSYNHWSFAERILEFCNLRIEDGTQNQHAFVHYRE
jgi:hypothetical protein